MKNVKHAFVSAGFLTALLASCSQQPQSNLTVSGLDPEIGSSNATLNGIDQGFYPQARVWTVGLNLKF